MSTEEMRYFNMIEQLKAADARVSDLEVECERLRAALRKHAGHSYECANGDEPIDDCTCGYDAEVPPLLAGAGKA